MEAMADFHISRNMPAAGRPTRSAPAPALCALQVARSEEEGEYEYISDHGGKEEHHVEPAVLYQPLPEAAAGEAEGVMRDTSAGVGGGAHAYGKQQKYRVRLRTKKGSWTKTFDTYCGIVGGAFFTPGVDVFGAPAEVACAGYGVYKAVEAIIENL